MGEKIKQTPPFVLVSEVLGREIMDGAVTGILPPYADIAERFGVRTDDVGKAIRVLEESGFVIRRRGARAKVITQYPK